MDWTHLKPADGRLMPWKNGGGTTLELAVDPPGATLDTGFRWRISSAEVGVSGPFSAFPGLERWLFLLDGRGFELDFGFRGRHDLVEPLSPIRFSGDWPASATLVEGPCTDFNLMVDPRACRAELRCQRLAAPQMVPLRAATTLLFVAAGTVSVPAWGLHLGPRHTLRVERGEGALQVIPGYGGAEVILIALDAAEGP
ncbi:MAG TPA: HutD family protein [Geothrix sp.]|nr:HutD family protein [Geothrix sp.]